MIRGSNWLAAAGMALALAGCDTVSNLSSQPASLGDAARGVSGDLLLANRDLPEGDRGVLETLGEWEARVYLA